MWTFLRPDGPDRVVTRTPRNRVCEGRTGSAHGWGMEGGAHRANVRRPWARLALVLPALLVCALCAIAFVRASNASRLRGPGRTELEAGIDGYLEVRSPACLHRTSATHRQQSHLPLASSAVLCCQLPGTAESGAHLSGCVSLPFCRKW